MTNEELAELFRLLGAILEEVQGLRGDFQQARKDVNPEELRKQSAQRQLKMMEKLIESLPPGASTLMKGVLEGMKAGGD